MSNNLARRLGYRPGSALIVTDVVAGKAAAQSGLQRLDLVLAINRQPVGTFDELKDILAEMDPGDDVLVLIRRGRRTFYTALRMPRS